MGDAGEGLIDADSRIQERLEELERGRTERHAPAVKDPAAANALESLRLARSELARQLEATTHAGRRDVLTQALADLDGQIAAAQARLADNEA